MLFIEYPPCSTCKKAKKYLQDQGYAFTTRHIVEQTPTKDELIEWITRSNLPFKKFFNTSGKVYRELKIKDQLDNMTLEEAAILLSKNGMLIKRPLVISDQCVLVGFNEKEYEKLKK